MVHEYIDTLEDSGFEISPNGREAEHTKLVTRFIKDSPILGKYKGRPLTQEIIKDTIYSVDKNDFMNGDDPIDSFQYSGSDVVYSIISSSGGSVLTNLTSLIINNDKFEGYLLGFRRVQFLIKLEDIQDIKLVQASSLKEVINIINQETTIKNNLSGVWGGISNFDEAVDLL